MNLEKILSFTKKGEKSLKSDFYVQRKYSDIRTVTLTTLLAEAADPSLEGIAWWL